MSSGMGSFAGNAGKVPHVRKGASGRWVTDSLGGLIAFPLHTGHLTCANLNPKSDLYTFYI